MDLTLRVVLSKVTLSQISPSNATINGRIQDIWDKSKKAFADYKIGKSFRYHRFHGLIRCAGYQMVEE